MPGLLLAQVVLVGRLGAQNAVNDIQLLNSAAWSLLPQGQVLQFGFGQCMGQLDSVL